MTASAAGSASLSDHARKTRLSVRNHSLPERVYRSSGQHRV